MHIKASSGHFRDFWIELEEESINIILFNNSRSNTNEIVKRAELCNTLLKKSGAQQIIRK